MQADTPLAAERPTRVRWLIFVLACASSWLLYLHRYSWGLIKPAFRAETGLSDTELGWLDSAFNAAYGFGQVPGGLAGDWWGPRAILAAITLLWSGAMVGVAWTIGFWQLVGMRVAFGLTQAGAYPILNKVTRNWVPFGIRTSAQGMVASMGRIGGACAPLIFATLLLGIVGLSWRTALLVLACPGVILAALLWYILRNSPREHPWANAAEAELVDGNQPPSPSAGQKVALHLAPANLFSLAMMLLYAFASTFQDQLYVYWIPMFLKEGRGLDDTLMGLFTPLPLIGGAIGGILGGVLNDVLIRKTGRRRWVRSGIGCTGKFLAAGLVLLSVQMADGRLAMVVLLAARFFGDWSLPTQWGAITDMSGRAAATVFGLVNMVGAAGGFAAGPILGYLKQHHGWEGLFLGVVAMCLLASVSWLFIDCTRRLVSD